MTTADTTTPTPDNTIAQRLLRIRDEMIVKNHLAGMEAKDAVHVLGHELEKIATFFSHAAHTAAGLPQEARLRTYLALFDANTRLLEMEKGIKAALEGAAHSATVVAETARVKAALGRMDAAAAVDERLAALRKETHVLEARSARVLDDIEARLTKLGVKASKVV